MNDTCRDCQAGRHNLCDKLFVGSDLPNCACECPIPTSDGDTLVIDTEDATEELEVLAEVEAEPPIPPPPTEPVDPIVGFIDTCLSSLEVREYFSADQVRDMLLDVRNTYTERNGNEDDSACEPASDQEEHEDGIGRAGPDGEDLQEQ